MLPDVMKAVTGRTFPSRTAVLEGYARYRFKRRVYPGLVSEAGGRVEGVLYLNLDGRSLALLDEFEGPWYKKATVRVAPECGGLLCQSYLVADNCRKLLGREYWDVERFMRDHLKTYLRECKS